MSTVVAVRQPYDEPGEKTDVSLTGVVAKSTTWGAVYLNAWVETAGGVGGTVDVGGVVGVKRTVRNSLALFADVVIQEKGTYGLELSLERDFKSGVSLGPGISISRTGDGPGGLDVAFGIALFKVFGG